MKAGKAHRPAAQLLDKLVENALDFARPETAVEVRLTRGLGIAFLSVANLGPPLAPEIADRIFESMVSARPREDGSKVHLGLGLTIVRAIADFHQASVAAANRPDGQGDLQDCISFARSTVAAPAAERAWDQGRAAISYPRQQECPV